MPHSLVTGGAGFIGSHLCEALLACGDRVTAFDDLSTGRSENLADSVQDDRFRFVRGTVTDSDALAPLVAEADRVFHLASAVGVRLIIDQPVRTIESIVEGTQRVLDLAAQSGKPTLITSSSEVYGKGSQAPFNENDDVVLGPTSKRRWAYACGKMLDEFLALAHHRESGLPVVCVRLFNTVGPRQTGRYGMVLPRFIEQARDGKPITVFGDGEQSRCFCHVADAVGALVKLIDTPASFGRVVNIGSDEEVTITQLAERVRDLAGKSSSIEHVPYDQAYVEGFEDMRRRVPDLSLACELIGYQPTHTLDAIIRALIEAPSSSPPAA